MDKSQRNILKHAIYEVVQAIPYGRATSYSAIAKAIGYPNLSRFVGKIMSECDSINSTVPAHRVVNHQGVLSAKKAFGLSDELEKLLESEGIRISNNHILNWKQVFWNPLDEIQL